MSAGLRSQRSTRPRARRTPTSVPPRPNCSRSFRPSMALVAIASVGFILLFINLGQSRWFVGGAFTGIGFDDELRIGLACDHMVAFDPRHFGLLTNDVAVSFTAMAFPFDAVAFRKGLG